MTPKQRKSRENRDAAIAEAERIYRLALEDYNDGIRAARQAYEKTTIAVQKQWAKENYKDG